MKPESLKMVKQYQNLFQPIIERGGYVADVKNQQTMLDPVNLIIPGLIRVAEGDIEGVPAGDYPLNNLELCVLNGNYSTNRMPIVWNIITLSLSENIKLLGEQTINNLYNLQSLLLPSTLESGNMRGNFNALGNINWQGLDEPLNRATWAPDGPRATGLGTQPTDKPVNPSDITGVTTPSILYELYYPLTMPYYLKSILFVILFMIDNFK